MTTEETAVRYDVSLSLRLYHTAECRPKSRRQRLGVGRKGSDIQTLCSARPRTTTTAWLEALGFSSYGTSMDAFYGRFMETPAWHDSQETT